MPDAKPLSFFNQWYEPQGKPWTHYSAASSGEFDLIFSSAVVVREGGLIQSGDISISQFLKSTFQSYVQAFNKKYRRTGQLFEGNPQAKIIDKDAYLLHICRYIHLNPVESNIVQNIENWPYSNYLEFIGKQNGKLFESSFLRNFYQSSDNYQEFVLEYLNEKLRYSEIRKYL